MKKGFTLIELIAVITIIAIVSLLVIPTITDSITKSKENLYNIQVSDIEASAKKWSLENADKMDTTHLNDICISLKSLTAANYFDRKELKDPRNKTAMNGSVKISYDVTKNQYDNKYEEKKCNAIITNGFIYEFIDNNWVKTEKNSIVSAGTKIFNKYNDSDLIKTVGQTTDGLYDLDDKYVFSGNEVENYAKFDNSSEIWRILSINKTNNSLKLILTNPIQNAWDTNNNILFENSTVSSVQLDSYYKNINSNIKNIINKVEDKAIWNVGSVTDISSYTVLKSVEVGKTSYAKLGLINLSDYVGASTDLECKQNYLSNTCQNTNYLFNIFTGKNVWTINNNGQNIYTVNQSGNIELVSPSTLNYIYPVVELKTNAYIESGDGKSTSPYVIK